MGTSLKVIKEIRLAGTSNGEISVGIIEEPYGMNSDSVVSIAVSLQSDSHDVDWKVHIPRENIDDIIEALKTAKAEM
jgi:hypothetical protein